MMKNLHRFSIIIILFFSFQISFSQEWKNLKEYQKETGKNIINSGSWLKTDRVKNTESWKQANKFNLSIENGNLKYKTISQIRDFYLWFDTERKTLGHEVNVFGIAALVAGQFSYFDNYFIRTFIVKNKEVIWFGNQGAKEVIAYFFPLIRKIYFSKNILKNIQAKDWDIKVGKIEQCKVVEAIYNQLSPKAIYKLERMAKGKGIFTLGIKKGLKYEGDIEDCKTRYKHAFTKLNSHYSNKNKTKSNTI